MELKEFFTNTFFTVLIGLSATIVVLTYFLTIQNKFWENLRRRRMETKISTLHDHYIICGFGRVGKQIADELGVEKVPFVVIDKEDVFALCKQKGWLYIQGDASKDEEILKRAKIVEAKGLLIAVGSDADCVFITVSARALNPNLFIVARASSQQAADKLRKVGANRIALPYQIGGYHMAVMALRPAVVDFIDTIFDSRHDELHVEQMSIDEKSKLSQTPLKQYLSRDKTKVVVLAIIRKSGASVVNPMGDTTLLAGDNLILMGTRKDLDAVGRNFSR